MNRDIILNTIKELFASNFEIGPDSISPEKLLDDDLGLDSLDMVDIILYLKDHIGDKVNPSLFKNTCTVGDIIDLLEPLWDLKGN